MWRKAITLPRTKIFPSPSGFGYQSFPNAQQSYKSSPVGVCPAGLLFYPGGGKQTSFAAPRLSSGQNFSAAGQGDIFLKGISRSNSPKKLNYPHEERKAANMLNRSGREVTHSEVPRSAQFRITKREERFLHKKTSCNQGANMIEFSYPCCGGIMCSVSEKSRNCCMGLSATFDPISGYPLWVR